MPKINKVFCLDKEVVDDLNKLDVSASSYVNQLLIDHFHTIISPKEILGIKKLELHNIMAETNKVELQVKELEKQEEIKQAQIQEQEEIYSNSDERWNKLSSIQYEAFDQYDWPKQDKENLFKEYMLMLRYGEIPNLIEYAKFKGIQRKEKRQEKDKELKE